MALSFPYPQLGTEVREPGNGCTVCVHKEYCTALYWLRRYVQEGQKARVPDDHNGLQCGSWSNDPKDRITTWDQDDLDENERLNDEGILTEPNQNITDAVTGGRRKYQW